MESINNPQGAEKRAFRMHKDILWSIIKSQAGTLGKAVLELVMNSIDAGASKVSVDLTGTRLVVSDDGKGFQSREEIENWFETFGTPHEKGDARYGRFRMGRGQVMAFTRNRWRSGTFSMFVDIRDLGLEYELTTESKPHKGCQIEGELYEKLSPSEVIRVTDNIRDLCKYAPIPVLVNGERVSVDLEKEKWTFVDDDAYYLLRAQARQLEVYNLGVHVRNYWGEYGIGGIVVSKQQLEVNFARNDILLSECEVWKRVSAKVKAYAKQFEAKKPTQNDAWRDLSMSRLLAGSFDSIDELDEMLRDGKVFTDYSGKHMSLTGLRNAMEKAGNLVMVPSDYSLKADKVHQGKLAVVLSPKTIERAKHMPLADIIKRIQGHLVTFMGREVYGVGYSLVKACEAVLAGITPEEQLTSMINDRHHVVPDKELTKDEKLVLRVLDDLNHYFVHATGNSTAREIKVCESETVEGYTDGAKKIFVERKLLKIGGTAGRMFASFEKLRGLLVHEYLHRQDDSTGHGHPPEFYEEFHDLMLDSENLREWTFYAVSRYVAQRRKAGVKMRAGDLHALDVLLVVDDKANEEPAVEVEAEATAETKDESTPPPAQPTSNASAVRQPQESLQLALV